MKKRTFLTALPFFMAAACARAKAGHAEASSDLNGMPQASLAELLNNSGAVAWYKFEGSVRLIAGNANDRSASLHRAIAANEGGRSVRVFDVWQVEGVVLSASASVTIIDQGSSSDPNDAGTNGIWFNRTFTNSAMRNPSERSRLSRTSARVMVIDATQIWLVEGGLSTAPGLNGVALAAFEAWRSS